MNITKVFYNGRERDRRGQITNFENLPIEVKENFKKIKESIQIHFNKEMDVRVIGSHLEGYYDEFSDYDVVINEDVDLTELELEILNKHQISVNIIFDTNEYSTSIIS
jgi:predicted nucleotidyltransferase